ncbi:MAG TPA: hypothetical protein VM166_01665 [Gemmatimonadaceae bacterium]|nr:hypothetical protein [Gemmatimonadaceae bacterium]
MAETTIAGDSSTTLDSSSAGKKPDCEATGRWAKCSVEKRLVSAGFVLIPAPAPPKRAGFSVMPIAYTLGHARLELFFYSDERALSRDVAQLDTARAAPIGGTNSWETTPVFVRSANLAAVFLTDNPRQAERLTLALTAGAPQRAEPQVLKPSISTPSSPR